MVAFIEGIIQRKYQNYQAVVFHLHQSPWAVSKMLRMFLSLLPASVGVFFLPLLSPPSSKSLDVPFAALPREEIDNTERNHQKGKDEGKEYNDDVEF